MSTCITRDTPDFIAHYDNEEVSSRASQSTINQRARHGVQVTRNWGMNKSWRMHCVVIAAMPTGLPGPALSAHIIGTEFERMRDTCINFTGRLVKLVPLRFQRRYGAAGSAPSSAGRQVQVRACTRWDGWYEAASWRTPLPGPGHLFKMYLCALSVQRFVAQNNCVAGSATRARQPTAETRLDST